MLCCQKPRQSHIKRAVLALAILLLLPLGVEAKNLKACDTSLGENEASDLEGTDNLISYLARLYEERIVSFEDLIKVQKALQDQNKLINPLADYPQTTSKIITHRDQLDENMQHAKIDLIKFSEWLEKFIIDCKQVHQAKQEAKNETLLAATKPIFHRVEPEEFDFRGITGTREHEIKISHPMMVQSTVITKKMWSDLMDGESLSNAETDVPKTNISWWQAALYANKLSEIEGLPLVYNLDGVEFDENFKVVRLRDIRVRVNAPQNDVYQTTGYRLPTKDEYLFLITDGGRLVKEAFASGIRFEAQSMDEYTWCGDSMVLHRVGEKKPFLINGKEFFDLYGDAQQFLHDPVSLPIRNEPAESSRYIGGYSPTMPCDQVHAWGGIVTNIGHSVKNATVGFRLVRTLPK